ncbi:probable transcription factor At1g11510 [Setaria italica]|nr:probable transcription factor At1g11510 [Setaria italica]
MGIPNFQILASPLSTASSDDTTTTNVSDEHLSPPSSPSISFDSVSESDASTSSSVASDGSSGSEPVVSKKPRLPVRSWLASDEIALLEAVSEHRQKHGRLPSPNHLAAALRSRLRAKDRLSADEISRRLRALRSRYDNAVLRMSRGTIPVKDDDVTIYKLSKLIWEGTRKGKREKKTRAADMRKDPREFGELTGLYPCLSAEVEAIDTGSGAAAAGLLKRAFERIGDDTAARLEAKVKMQRVAEARASAKLDQLRTNVAKVLLQLIE